MTATAGAITRLYIPIFRRDSKIFEGKNFSDSSLHRILESENLRFSFSSMRSEMRKLKLKKIVGNQF